MAAIAGINTAVTTVGAREDLANTITNISPDETPLYTNARKTIATAINHEWQTDTLDASTINSHVEGESISTSTASPTTRLGNILQISQRNYGVSGTIQALNLAGRSDELLRLRMKKGLELRRDMEVVLHTNQVRVSDTGGSSTRLLSGLPTWITSVGGMSSAVSVAPTTGNGGSAVGTFTGSTAVTYEFISSAMEASFTAGGKIELIELPPRLKRQFSLLAFGTAPSTAQIRYNVDGAGQAIAVGAVEKWQSDFGLVDIIVNRNLKITNSTFLQQAIFMLETEGLAVAQLRTFDIGKLAKTGDGTQEYVISEYTLEVTKPAAQAAVYGVT